jgi:hypothetical protein
MCMFVFLNRQACRTSVECCRLLEAKDCREDLPGIELFLCNFVLQIFGHKIE